MPETSCRGCGRPARRTLTTLGPKGEWLREECPGCHPELFEGPRPAPSDQRPWMGPEVYPRLYRRGEDGVYRAKDELIADTAALWDKGPTATAEEKKRATRRTEPLSPAEIERAQQWGERVLAPLVKKAQGR